PLPSPLGGGRGNWSLTGQWLGGGLFVRAGQEGSGRGWRFGLIVQYHQRMEFHLAVVVEAGARRDDVAHDDVFLEAAQVINARHGGGFGEDTGGVLEGGSAEEALGFERGYGDAKEDGLGFAGFSGDFLDALV